MSVLPRIFLAALTFVLVQVTVSSGQEKSASKASDPLKSGKPIPAQLQEIQIDVSLEARDIERVLSKLKKASELSKQRITEAAIKAEAASVSLEKGDSKAAGEEARQTAEMFKEIAKQLEALLTEETPQRIAEARQMARQLAQAERDFAEKLEEALKPMEGSGKAKGDARSKAASKNGSDGKSDEKQSQENNGPNGNEKEADEGGGIPQIKGKSGKDSADGPGGRDPRMDKNKPNDSQAKTLNPGLLPHGSNDRDDKKGDKTKPGGAPAEKLDNKPKDGGSEKQNNKRADRDDNKTGPGDMPDDPKDGLPSNDRDDKNSDKTQSGGGPVEKLGDKPKDGGSGKNGNKAADRSDKETGSGDMPEGSKKRLPPNRQDDLKGDKTPLEGERGETTGDKPKGDGAAENNSTLPDRDNKTGPGDTTDAPTNGIPEGAEKREPINGAGKKPGAKAKGRGSSSGTSEPNEDIVEGGSDRGNRDTRKTEGSGGAGIGRLEDNRRNGVGQALTAAERRELAAERAAMLAESGKTLQDVLREIAKSTDPGDKDSVAKIEAVVKEIDIDNLVEEMSQVSLMVRSKRDGDAKLSSLDVAERLEIMAQRLDTAYRAIVAPQAEELRKLEQALLDLRERLEKLETPSQVAGWHRDLRELLNELDKLGVTLQVREEFEKEMKKMGISLGLDLTKQIPDWTVVDGRYIVPDNFKLPLINLQEDIQQRIQTLILGDLGNISDDAIPPKYQELVERYYQVLSRQNGTSGTAKKPAPRNRK